MKKTVIQTTLGAAAAFSKPSTLAVAIALALPLGIVPAAQAQTQAEQTYQFNIHAKSLPQAIADLSAVTGLQVLYTEQSTFDHRARALQGNYSVREALQQLLDGSGLVVRFTGDNAVTI